MSLYRDNTGVYDLLRSKKRKQEVSLDEEDETISKIKAYYSEEGLNFDIEKALLKIKEEYKEILLLYYQQGFDYKEIAEMRLMPINTVKTHLSRGKEQLKEVLKEYGKN